MPPRSSDVRAAGPPAERALPAWALAVAGWLLGAALLAARRDPWPSGGTCAPDPPDCTLERRPPPPPAATPREWRGARGIGRRRALQIARALWEAGERDAARVDLEALPGIGRRSADQAREWARGRDSGPLPPAAR